MLDNVLTARWRSSFGSRSGLSEFNLAVTLPHIMAIDWCFGRIRYNAEYTHEPASTVNNSVNLPTSNSRPCGGGPFDHRYLDADEFALHGHLQRVPAGGVEVASSLDPQKTHRTTRPGFPTKEELTIIVMFS